MTSPPIPNFLAFLSVITPCDVEMIAIPKPLSTRGSFSHGTVTRRPGLEIFFKPEITLTPFTPYFKIPEIDSSILEDEYFPSRPFDEEAIYYDVHNRNKIILKPKGGFDPFDF